MKKPDLATLSVNRQPDLVNLSVIRHSRTFATFDALILNMNNVSKLKSLQKNQVFAIEIKTLMARDKNFMKKLSVWQAAAVFKGRNVSSTAVILIYLQLNQTRVVKTAYHTNLYY